MKRIILIVATLFGVAGVATAQDGCMAFFPDRPGTKMVSKSYDGMNNQLSTMTYIIDESYDYPEGRQVFVTFILTDNNDNQIDRGRINAGCHDGIFSMQMTPLTMVPGMTRVLSAETELISDFIDYPDPFERVEMPYFGDLGMDGAEFTVRSKGDNNEYMRVRIYDREFENTEKIRTPAGTFDAAKVSFRLEVIENGASSYKHGREWYSGGAGVVKTEIYDDNNTLENYTVLTSID